MQHPFRILAGSLLSCLSKIPQQYPTIALAAGAFRLEDPHLDSVNRMGSNCKQLVALRGYQLTFYPTHAAPKQNVGGS
jgi:hypothetical protein